MRLLARLRAAMREAPGGQEKGRPARSVCIQRQAGGSGQGVEGQEHCLGISRTFASQSSWRSGHCGFSGESSRVLKLVFLEHPFMDLKIHTQITIITSPGQERLFRHLLKTVRKILLTGALQWDLEVRERD